MAGRDPELPGRLAALLHHRWTLPILAELGRDDGGKFVTLAHRLGAGRDALSRTLTALIEADLVARNTGHGHPLRPEYVLTPRGAPIAVPARALLGELADLGATDAALNKWSLPVLLAVASGRGRFSALLATLPGLTSRGLSLGLKTLEAAGLLKRRPLDTGSPSPVYTPSDAGQRLMPLLDALTATLPSDLIAGARPPQDHRQAGALQSD